MKYLLLLLLYAPVVLHAQCEAKLKIAQTFFDQGQYWETLRSIQQVEEEGCRNYQKEIGQIILRMYAQIQMDSAKFDHQLAAELRSYISFIDGRWGLAMKNIGTVSAPEYRYGYIDKEGKELTPFIYEEASPFPKARSSRPQRYVSITLGAPADFAQVTRDSLEYLLDTTGCTYLLTTGPDLPGPETEAWWGQGKLLDSLLHMDGNWDNVKVLIAPFPGFGTGPRISIEGIGQLSQLTYLDLSHNQLDGLPAEIGKLRQLKSLLLSRCSLGHLPTELFQLRNLETLHLDFNYGLALPPEIGNLSKLSYLDLSSSGLHQLPPEIGKLANLTFLDLEGNSLRRLPAELGNLSKLQTLRANQTPSIGMSFSMMDTVDKDGPPIFPEDIWNLSNLQTLILEGWPIGNHINGIEKLTRLRILNLSMCKLDSFPPVQNLVQLEYLNLSYNSIYQIPHGISALQNLRVIDLRASRIHFISDEICTLPKLEVINSSRESYIDRNPISEIPSCYLDKLTRDQQMEWVLELLEDGRYKEPYFRMATLVLEHFLDRIPYLTLEESDKLNGQLSKLEIKYYHETQQLKNLISQKNSPSRKKN